MDVLCVVAHPDDEVIGPGGTLARHAANGDTVHVSILSDGVTSRYDDETAAREEIETRRSRARLANGELDASVSFHSFPDNEFDSVPLLDIVQTVEDEIAEHDPDVIYTHHWGDLNIDHELVCRATVTAARPLQDSSISRILAFETLSSSEWAVPKEGNVFQPTVFMNIEDHLDSKISALEAYTDELRAEPHPRSVSAVKQNVSLWGSKCGTEAAEPFVLLREVTR